MSWYYARGGQQRGPVEFQKLVAAAKTGKLRQDDLVWTEGMAEWKPAAEVPEFGLSGAVSAAPAAAAVVPHEDEAPAEVATPVVAAPAEVSYYSNQGSLPARASTNLKGFAAPTGDVGIWPLDDAHVAQWVEACKHRKNIRAAHGLFRGLCALNIIFAVIVGIGALAAAAASRNGAAVFVGVGVATLAIAAFAVLFGFAASATRRNQVWGPIAITAVVGLGIVLQLGSLALAMGSGGRDAGATAIGGFFGLLLNVAFLWVSARAIPAIKKFRAVPAWCQELTAAGKL